MQSSEVLGKLSEVFRYVHSQAGNQPEQTTFKEYAHFRLKDQNLPNDDHMLDLLWRLHREFWMEKRSTHTICGHLNVRSAEEKVVEYVMSIEKS